MHAAIRSSVIVLLSALAACGGESGPTTPPPPPPPPPPVVVGSVTVAPTSPAALVPGQTVALTAMVRDEQGNTLTDRAVTWSSGATSTATVSGAGVVTAAGPGTTQVTATVEGKSGSAAITVDDGGLITAAGGSLTAASGAIMLQVPAQGVSAATAIRVTSVASPPTHPRLVVGTAFDVGTQGTTIAGGGTLRIAYATLPEGVAAGALRVHRWDGAAWQPLPSTVNAAGLTVSGEVTTLGRFALVALVPVAAVTVTPLTLNLEPGTTGQLTAQVRGPANELLEGRSIAWTSSNQAVATVSNAGLVTAVTEGGPVTITATVEGQAATATVSVVEELALANLVVSYDHTCGLTSSGQAWCWGSNSRGQLGSGAMGGDVPTPLAAAGNARYTRLAVGYRYSCGLTAAGAAQCWGNNDSSVFGDNAVTSSFTPHPVSGGHVFTRLVGSSYHICGLSAGGTARCWGYNEGAAVGDGTASNRFVPTLVQGGQSFTDITLGALHTCGLTAAGAAWCWGTNSEGQVGNANTQTQFSPVQVGGGHVFAQLVAGEWHTCGRKASGEVWCWGWNGRGQLGDGTTTNRSTPVKVVGGDAYASIHPSGWSTCGLLASGLAKCWGENFEGTLGNGGSADSPTPVNVTGGHAFTNLTSGLGYHYCGVRTDSVVLCWGMNDEGQVGDGSFINRSVPTLLSMPALGGLRAGIREEGASRARDAGAVGPTTLRAMRDQGRRP